MNQVYKKNQKSDAILIFFLLILAFDVLVFLLAIFGYYFTFIKSTNNILPILVTLAAFYALAWVRKIEKFWVISLTIIVALILGWFSLTNNSYDTINSPTGNIKVMIGHRNISLGETTHFYNFYLYSSVPGLMKKVNDEPLTIMSRGGSNDSLEVLGVDNAEWVKDEKIIFDPSSSTNSGLTQVDLKR